MFQSSSSSSSSSASSLFLVAFELSKKEKKNAETLRDERGAETLWNILEGEVVGKKTKEGNKEKK